MYTNKQKIALKKLEEYLEEASDAQLEADRQSVSKWADVGPKWNTYLSDLSKMLTAERRPVNQIVVQSSIDYRIRYTTSPGVYERSYNQSTVSAVQEPAKRYANEPTAKN